MKKSSSLLINIFIAFVGAAAIHYSSASIPSSLAFFAGSLISTIYLYYCFCRASRIADTKETAESNSKTLYVGNLPYRANEDDVKALFSNYGKVFSVRLMKDKRTGKRKGFGFVVMANKDAPYATEQLNNKEYMDRTLKVREANEPKMQDSE